MQNNHGSLGTALKYNRLIYCNEDLTEVKKFTEYLHGWRSITSGRGYQSDKLYDAIWNGRQKELFNRCYKHRCVYIWRRSFNSSNVKWLCPLPVLTSVLFSPRSHSSDLLTDSFALLPLLWRHYCPVWMALVATMMSRHVARSENWHWPVACNKSCLPFSKLSFSVSILCPV